MRVIPPSYEIMKELDEQSLAVRIEVCGRLCYKSEDKITPESAPPFIKRILQHGHNSVAEMAVLTLKVEVDSESIISQLYGALPRYLHLDRLEKKILIISGSVRAFRELYLNHPSLKIVKGITSFLADKHPLFFEDILPKRGIIPQQGVLAVKMPLDEVEALSVDLMAKHRFIAVKFTVNRAVTHEMVRHRPCGFLQESQRYCRYSESKFDNQVTFIKPMFYDEGSDEYRVWEEAMVETEKLYLKLLETSSPQAARTVLGTRNSCR